MFTDDEWDVTWSRLKTPDGAVHLDIPELLEELAAMATPRSAPGDDPAWPFVLSAGERHSFTANTILRDPAWRKRDTKGALRVGPADAAAVGLATAAPRGSRPTAARSPSASRSTTACSVVTSACRTASAWTTSTTTAGSSPASPRTS